LTKCRLKHVVRNPVVKAPADGVGRIDLEDIAPSDAVLVSTEEERSRRTGEGVIFEAMDVLFGKLRPYLRKSILCSGRGLCSPELLVLRPDRSRIEPHFLHYIVRNARFAAWAQATSKGTKMPRTDFDALGQYEVELPSLDEQRRIADFLDQEVAKLDELNRLKQQLAARLPERLSAAMHAAMAGLPREAKLGYAGSWYSGGTPPKDEREHWSGPVPWASTKDLATDDMRDTLDHVTHEAAHTFSRVVPAGAVLIATRGMALAKRLPLAVIRRPVAFNQDLKALVPAPGVEADFLRIVLRGYQSELLAAVVESAHGTRRLETRHLKALRIPIPNPDTQRRIAGEVREVEVESHAVAEALRRQMHLLQERRDALITAAVTGELDPSPYRASVMAA
jgi:type I restriction enzyme, S subunit